MEPLNERYTVDQRKKKNHTHVQLMKNRVFKNVNKIWNQIENAEKMLVQQRGWHSLNFF